jgi:hypothetical protein
VAFTFKQEPLMLGEVESLTLVTFLYSIKLFRVVYIFASFMFDQTTNSELDENRVNLCLILVLEQTPFPVVQSRISQCYTINDSCYCECNQICMPRI